jgi:hypothetical protein
MEAVMKKSVYLFFALLFAFSLTGCRDKPDDTPTPPDPTPLTLDQRLVGKWYQWNSDTWSLDYSLGYYEFFTSPNRSLVSEGTELCDIYNSGSPFQNTVYSENGIIYSDTKKKLLQYGFHNSFPYPDSYDYNLTDVMRITLNKRAADGGLITYKIYNSDGYLYDDGRRYQKWFLVKQLDYDLP